ncbi:MAG TPA: 16S rRNA (adenine(1518)-N(6)/adenine(1519)-N(6))-dimethyltransferase RsmA [Flexilinea sp.]|nr:16S rRNA (adenine(1518)-N(6)/adenine(1519)-N(6))-dimethyltransferase RsmA [Flexilinea sp.]HOW07473.1 16S rRNA (adenine(1518)-N(6)/adenine(1519)-N(6))-dimethyltransferase RsmA [Flexilinea sp.]HPS47201.1 16S rRNA (adenine(1518)-N(6)/adenine(1519)-N(6))-dimethyltransferase RsmA [Flexilinea sp.]
MKPLAPLPVRQLLNRYHLTPSKGLGQNFLVDDEILSEIVRIAEIPADSTVLEIGPGLGGLTRYLAEAADDVVAVELDRRMIPPLKEVLKEYDHVRIIQGDILEIDPDSLIVDPAYSVVANIPYYITSAVIRHLLNAKTKPRRIVLTVQKEVAQRICAQPGDLSLLALSVQIFGSVSIPLTIPADAFFPQPKVDSSVVKIDVYTEPLVSVAELDDFFRLAKAGFGQKRKTLRNSLSSDLRLSTSEVEAALAKAGIDPMRRAETVSIEEWKRLVESVPKNKNSR